MLILHFHQSLDPIYAIFYITADRDLMTFFVLQLSTQVPVSHDWKPFIFKLANCSVLFLPSYNIILVLLMPDEDGKFRGAPWQQWKDTHEAYRGGWDLSQNKSLFGIKFWHKNLLYWFLLKTNELAGSPVILCCQLEAELKASSWMSSLKALVTQIWLYSCCSCLP